MMGKQIVIVATILAMVGMVAIVALHQVQHRTVLDSLPPHKFLPTNGDYPGGATGIPEDGYWPMDTAHGVTPYFGDPSVVYNPNGVDFPYGGQDPYGAVMPRRAGLRKQQILADAYRGQISPFLSTSTQEPSAIFVNMG